MSFSSFQDFLHMGGYALYVWLSFGLSLLILSIVMFSPVFRHRQLLQSIDRHKRLAQREHRKKS